VGGNCMALSTTPLNEYSFNFPDHDDSLLREQLSRNSYFFGEDGQRSVEGSFVIVVGLGGVGALAYAVRFAAPSDGLIFQFGL
jgi:hypothetical protein